jgi:hypothetical protein
VDFDLLVAEHPPTFPSRECTRFDPR